MKKIFTVLLVIVLAVSMCACNTSNYNKAGKLMEDGSFKESGDAYAALGNYKDSVEKAKEAYYRAASIAMEAEDFETALDCYTKAADYSDSAEMLKEVNYSMAKDFFCSGEYAKAAELLNEISDYKDTEEYLRKINVMNVVGEWSVVVNYADVLNTLKSDSIKEIENPIKIEVKLSVNDVGQFNVIPIADEETKHEISDEYLKCKWDSIFGGYPSISKYEDIKDQFYDYTFNRNVESIPDFSNDENFVYLLSAVELKDDIGRLNISNLDGSVFVDGNTIEFADENGEIVGKGTIDGDIITISELNAYPLSNFPIEFARS